MQKVWFREKFVDQGYSMTFGCWIAFFSDFLGFTRGNDKMVWQIPLSVVSGIVQFNFANTTDFEVSVTDFLITIWKPNVFLYALF